jgi:hypothetical protein
VCNVTDRVVNTNTMRDLFSFDGTSCYHCWFKHKPIRCECEFFLKLFTVICFSFTF